MIDWKRQTLSILRDLNLKTSKSLGQNFLIKPSIIHKIIKNADISKDDKIIEIGGGVGILTSALLQTEAEISVIEKDPRLAGYLNSFYPSANIITGDALDIEWPEHNKVIANLPYSISSQILVKILHSNSDMAVIMVQKEVAERCVAKPGDRNYSRLSVICNLHAKVTKLFNVTPSAFFPRPKVTSSVIHLSRKIPILKNSHIEIENLVLSLFTLRRKTLRSAMKNFLKKMNTSKEILDTIPFGDKRIYSLTIEELDIIVSHLLDINTWPISNRS